MAKKKVTAAKPPIGGAIYVAPVGTTLPTNATASLNAAFNALGYISDDGMTNSLNRESETIKAWGGDTVLTLMTSMEDTFSFKLIEALNTYVLEVVRGSGNVSGSLAAGIEIDVNAADLDYYSWVVDMILADGVVERMVIPQAKVTDIAKITYVHTDAIGYDVTITAEPDDSGNSHYEYIYGASSAVADPVITISTHSATITCSTSDAVIHYTLNGQTPTEASAVYSAAVTTTAGQTIKAKAFKAGMLPSGVAVATD